MARLSNRQARPSLLNNDDRTPWLGRPTSPSDRGSISPSGGNAGGLSKRAKLGILLGLVLPSLLCISGLAFYLSWRARVSEHRDPLDQRPNGNNHENDAADTTSPLSPSRETRHASNGITGIDLATIESYPKIRIDDDGQVPRPNDNVCTICLSEYQPKEMLRTIPKCGHYFHAQCIDLWLRRNASCPLCRDHKGSSDSMTASN
ncbi:RING-H2 finger protein ATL47-like [Rhodamnia argentea]|uniref:RING-type E3 ubiquitin transferase n=1 Tax=Rhodamnia argentea TaxID=178133 RepID=A0ABM3H4V8_9MYRT|nr:RING-H2 finger protein ATL47-like [Rhodamnia argentea]